MTHQDRLKILDRHLVQLGEHFDAVEIVASRVRPDGATENYHRGQGNWYARFGLIQEHTLRCLREMSPVAHRDKEPFEPDPEGDPA